VFQKLFKGDGFVFFLCLDDIIAGAMDDPKFSKIYPIITNQNLLEELIRFIELPPKKIKGVGIANGELFKRENGRQISGSHRYLGVQEEDGTYNLYKKFKGGPLDSKNFFFSSFVCLSLTLFIYFSIHSTGETWLILRIRDESYRTTRFILEFAKTIGDMPRIRDVEDYFSGEKILVCRDRIQIILNHCHDAINIINKKSNVDYDVTNLSSTIPQQENLNPSSNSTINTVAAQQSKQSQSSTAVTSLVGTGSLKRLAERVISNAMPIEPVITPVASGSQEQTDTTK
jgi:hypothetical protein